MENKYNTFTFCISDYLDENDEENEFLMYSDIMKFIQLAFKNGYQMKLWYDGMTVVIEYDYQDACLGGSSLEWLSNDEYVAREGETE